MSNNRSLTYDFFFFLFKMISGNPSATITMMAERAVDFIKTDNPI